ncbi:Cyp6a9 [Trypoxylus dichotomus]
MLSSSVVYFTTLSVILLSLLIIYVRWLLTYWRRRGVPHLKPSFPFGDFHNPFTKKLFLGPCYKEFYDEFKRMGMRFGGIYSYISPVFVPADPNILKSILLEEFSSFYDRGQYVNEVDQPSSAGLSRLSGDRWREMRTKLTPTFTSARMKNMFPLIVVCGEALEKYVRQFAIDKKPLIVSDCVRRLSTDIISSCAFGIDCNSFENVTFYRALESTFATRLDPIRIMFYTAFPNLARALKMVTMPHKQVEFLSHSIDETMKYRADKNIVRDDFLQMLLDMKKDGILDMNEVYAQSIMFLVAGHGTTASGLTTALFELACNQNIQEKLRKEVRDVIAKHDGKITYEAVKEMKYLHMVLQETIRKHPPITTLRRKCVKDYPIPNSNVIIEKGTSIYVPVLGFHHDPKYYPEPEKFLPERFSKENINKIVPYTYLPFGEGPRFCIGDRFAKLQAKIGLINFIKNYKVTLNPKVNVPPSALAECLEGQNILLDVTLIED